MSDDRFVSFINQLLETLMSLLQQSIASGLAIIGDILSVGIPF